MKNLSIIGSTGSIGTQTLDIIRKNPDKFNIVGLSAGTNVDLLKKQIKEFKPEIVSVSSKELVQSLNLDIPLFHGMAGLTKVATLQKADTIVTSVVGSIGVLPTIKAIKAGKNIALANKETLVAAGDIVMNLVKENDVNLMPIDSEHSALFQCLNGEDIKTVKKIILTCSGGSFRGKKTDDLRDVTVKEALNHPNWSMGGKITIDSATLMNKGLEVIEAHHLYNIDYDKIQVVIHPQSIIHSMIEYIDSSIIAQLGVADMRIPIVYALTYPNRILNSTPLDLLKMGDLTFNEPDLETFKCLKYGFEAGKIGGTMPCVMNATNESAVSCFLKGKIKFLDIARSIKTMMDKHKVIMNPSIEQVLDIDKRTKLQTLELLKCFP